MAATDPTYDHERNQWSPQCPYGDVCTGCDAAGRCSRIAPTERGFSPPRTYDERNRHKREQSIIVRLTQYEHDLLRPGSGVSGKFCLIRNEVGTFDLVRYADA